MKAIGMTAVVMMVSGLRLMCRRDRPREQLVRDRAGVLKVPQPGDQHEVLPPAEDLVDGRELAGEADRLAYVRRLRGDVEAVDPGGASVGLEQGRQDLHDRGLAGPLEPSRAKMVPSVTVRSRPVRTRLSPKDLASPRISIAGALSSMHPS